ncbi:cytochrome P450 142 [Mycolicibacterium phlei]|uniref:Steroid C26-monooxygenase n=2 Tax=Mycolicibacterium phlei TaxID=1771 RepID=A0A5N5V334_MYCPH|nr:cytochrome P450 [Mycolicibacterium phlei]VEG09063.1 cytochrome P450 142 [Mycobacteroides chelonae]AMO60947.1 Cytochrome P450-terp [Mycolicibacterium phlei]KAB7754910.1 cytochrome P450 [Mycolicibacterium phlei DSM 43239 = CCUG 21000]KXW63253.1 cytochrome P450 [Mycolicibacterium phlei DSM 43070]KXW64595.1 cytochrome P450 [Mycolicibacterium phlei DSM 43239 = CCUG 21000]
MRALLRDRKDDRVTGELTEDVKEAQARFDEGMGAVGDASPYPMLKELRAKAPVHPGWPEMGILENPPEGQQIFTAYSFDAVKAVFTDNQTFSTRCYEAIVRPLQGPTILEMQEPEHAVYRRLHEFAFARSSMRRWEAELVRPLVERTVARIRDAKRADLVEEIFMPIPVRVIAALLGLPESEISEFHRLAIDLLGFHADMETALQASAQLKEYFVGILADRRREPRDDMVSVLAQADIDGVRMSDEQIYGFMRNLLPAGAETTSRSTASLALGLLTHPDQLAAVIADRDLLPQAIEEGIRWETPLLNFMRETTRDVEFYGHRIPAGSTVSVNLGSANHDETRWDRPEDFDIFRERKPHIGFGHGAHVCLGMHLARLESTVIFNTLFDQLPGLRLDPEAPAPYVAGMYFRSPPHLPVVWD